MEVKYSKHLKTRIELRKIDYELLQKIFEKAEERFIAPMTCNHTPSSERDKFPLPRTKILTAMYL